MTPTAPPIDPFLWLMVVLLSVALYAALDGYDLGVGTLLLFERDDRRRKAMIEIIATSWDGNEAWLILVGIGLFAGFPLAYSTLLPALYVPVILMLLALIFRGASIEFQMQSPGRERGWRLAFALGSLVAAFSQGVILGSIVAGIPTQNGHFAGTSFGFLGGFSVLMGLLLVCLYCLMGASWLNDKTTGAFAASAQQKGRILAVVVAVLFVVTMIAAPRSSPVFGSAFNTQSLFVIGATILALGALWMTWFSLKRLDNATPFLLAEIPLVLALLCLVVITFPYLVPPRITFWQAAAPTSSVDFLLITVGFSIPVTLGYNAYAYYVFRGKFSLPEQRRA